MDDVEKYFGFSSVAEGETLRDLIGAEVFTHMMAHRVRETPLEVLAEQFENKNDAYQFLKLWSDDVPKDAKVLEGALTCILLADLKLANAALIKLKKDKEVDKLVLAKEEEISACDFYMCYANAIKQVMHF